MSILNVTSKKYAVIIGINYTGTASALEGCINDAINLKTFLVDKCHFTADNILILADDGVSELPTKDNILNAFNTLITKANEGFTELWLSYSGHGSYVSDQNGDEADKRDEVICPLDYSSKGMIIDDFIYSDLVCKLPSTVTLFSVMDCCNSGTVFDLPYLYTTANTVNNTNNKHVATVISISGCRDDQTSADAYINSQSQGAMTWSFLNALNNANYDIKLVDLLNNMRILLKNNYTQVPMLAVTSTDQYDRKLLTPPEPVIAPTAKAIKFKVSVDYWYTESTWNIWSASTSTYIFPTFNKFSSRYQTTEITKELPLGTYKLVVKDTYGDGGVTSLVSDGLVTLVSGKMITGKLAEYTFTVA